MSIEQEKRMKMIEKILNHQVQGEVYILTPGRVWKSLVLKYFNKLKSGEMTIDELVILMEDKGGVKYGQSYKLVRYPVEELIRYIAKIAKQTVEIK
ncbi:hypothetical protein [Mesobacillus zeae]|uniref:Uncharacterized protein n=1 Tax=Mesobacillus zeae TaxID=1917180 RepID=A0A398AZZ8_9BACI|nr:hypothetical protein [Mesobacillus zeae]RID82604.1 hypothetical protein D1970_18455 [Mesobacillus zeae]